MVLVQGNTVNLHRHGGNHVRWFLIHDKRIKFLDVNLLFADDISCDELSTAWFIEGLNGDLLDSRELSDDGFHLFQFDTETTNLHLTVLTPNKFDVARRQITHDVARAIDAIVFLLFVKRILEVDFCSLFGTVEIAPCHLWRSHPEFTRGTHGQTMSIFINNIALDVALRLADRDILAFLSHIKIGDITNGLRRTVAIGYHIILRRHHRRQLLTTRQQALQRLALEISGKLVGYLRRHEGVRDAVLLEIVVQGHQVEANVFRNDVKLCANGQTAKQFLN